jgi:ATP adenylyltransferase
MSLEHLWSGWRSTYVTNLVEERSRDAGDEVSGSVFERILGCGRPDEETFVVHRGDTCAVLMNIYPYTTGHVMVMPVRAVAGLDDLTPEEFAELWTLVRAAATAVQKAFGSEGLNIGLNLGAAAGAGVPDHLHVHVLPRWSGDTNFMTATANTRVLPVSLAEAWERLREAWPHELRRR